MKFILILFYVFLGLNNVFGQGKSSYFIDKNESIFEYYVIGDNVNQRKDTFLTSNPKRKMSFGEIYVNPIFKTKNWTVFFLESTYDTICISSKFLGSKERFFEIAKDKKDKSANTKYELLKIYKAKGDKKNIEFYAFDLMNNHHSMIPTDRESCDMFDTEAYEILLNGYPDIEQSKYPEMIMKQVKDSSIIAMAYIDAIKYSIYNKSMKKGVKYTKELIDYHLNHLILEGCDYSTYYSSYPILYAKNTIFTLLNLLDNTDSRDLYKFIEEKIDYNNRNKKNLKSEFCQDINKHLGGSFWEQHLEFKK